ncbi:AAA family ATPase [Prevotella pallens]|uniref:McrB family protein n=1 Tax=Prevotella pallens TaxID=60133 RepID=UPI0028EB9A9A|nr:AAA family ATPase [Prevotella pallens]
MKYISLNSVLEAYKGFQNSMTNKSWGYLAILKCCKSYIRTSVPYEVDLDEVSNFLENIFNLSINKKKYNTNRSLYVVFSNKWDKYFKEQGKFTPNIYDVIVWAYRRKSFEDNVTKEFLLQEFSKEFNIPLNFISGIFNSRIKDIKFVDSLYSEDMLKKGLKDFGVDVSKENIDAKKVSTVASPGEISRGPFIQTLYAGLEITDYVIILQSDFKNLYGNRVLSNVKVENTTFKNYSTYRPYITAIKSKPFLLLAGISGTGKSRIVRELARACWEKDSEEYKAQKPKNFQMVQVKPNWHDSSDLLGYVSRVSGKAEFVAGDFLKFIARAWENIDTPYFLCLDEMNLAPVEQYFAEYLSVIESRKCCEEGTITTDPILEKSLEDWYRVLTSELTNTDDVRDRFLKDGICIPQNLIVVGTVNMDETTFSFSRKVLDRAMTIEMNEVNLHGGLTERYELIGKLGKAELIGEAVEGIDLYADNKEVCDIVLNYLEEVNNVLENTPFKVAYRTRNEFLLYVVNNLPYNKDEEYNDLTEKYIIARALDEITSMKVLSRIEGDDIKVSDAFLDKLSNTIKEKLEEIAGEEKEDIGSISLKKLKEMKAKLVSGHTSFWS